MSTPQRYNLAYNYVFDKQSKYTKNVLINGAKCERIEQQFTKAFTREVCRVAESNEEIPAVKCNYVVPQATGVNN